MAKQTVNIGTAANDGTGDPLRTAFDKVNDNFDEVYGNNFVTNTRIADDAVTAPKLNEFDDSLTAATSGDILVSNGTDFIHATMSGDATIASGGALTIASDAVDGTKIADDSIDSEHYVDGSIDTAHFSLTAAINTVTDQNSGTLKLWSGTQAQYDALTPDASTIYFIV